MPAALPPTASRRGSILRLLGIGLFLLGMITPVGTRVSGETLLFKPAAADFLFAPILLVLLPMSEPYEHMGAFGLSLLFGILANLFFLGNVLWHLVGHLLDTVGERLPLRGQGGPIRWAAVAFACGYLALTLWLPPVGTRKAGQSGVWQSTVSRQSDSTSFALAVGAMKTQVGIFFWAGGILAYALGRRLE